MAKFVTNLSGAIWWPCLQPMQVMPSGGQIWNASGTIWWANLQLMQLAPSGDQIWNQCKWRHLVDNFVTNASGAMANYVSDNIS